MPSLKELKVISLTETPAFKAVLESWDPSSSTNEAEKEMSKILKGQQPKEFLTWLLKLKNKEVSPKKTKLKRDIIRESVKILGEILQEKESGAKTTIEPTCDKAPNISLQCSVTDCKNTAVQDDAKDVLDKEAEAIIKTLANLHMHWICTLCKEKLENNKELAQLNSHEIKTSEVETQTEELPVTSTLVQTEENETTNTNMQILQVGNTSIEAQTEETTIENTSAHTQASVSQEKTYTHRGEAEIELELDLSEQAEIEDEGKVNKTVEAKTVLAQTVKPIEQGQSQFGEEKIEQENGKQIEGKVQEAGPINTSKDKQEQEERASSTKIEGRKYMELQQYKLELEKLKKEIKKVNEELEQENYEEKEKPKNKLYSDMEKKSRKKYEEPKKNVFKRIGHPKSSLKISRNETEKEVAYVRKRLEHMMDYGGDWRKTMDLLRMLDRLDEVNLQIMTSTKIMWTLDDLQRYNRHPEVTDFTRRIVKRWRRLTPNDYRGTKYHNENKASRYKDYTSLKGDYNQREKSQDYHKQLLEYKENRAVAKDERGTHLNITKTFENLKIGHKVKRHVLTNITDIDNSTQY